MIYIESIMEWEEIARELSVSNENKIILLVMDGVGGLPRQGKTEIETAKTPNLDQLAKNSACGLSDPVFRGITPGSGPAHIALFGYDPLKYILGRGILEALGSNVKVGGKDLVARGNFATLKNGLIVDRRAGRIPTSENEKICEKINASLKKREKIDISLFPGKEHRFVVRFSGEGLSDSLSDADPQKDNLPPVPAAPFSENADGTAKIVNGFIEEATEILKDSSSANTVILRGFSKYPEIPLMSEIFKLNPAAIATYPMYKGLSSLVGMKIIDTGQEISDEIDALEKVYEDFDFFYVHIKKTDSAGEDGNFEEKVKVIEETDRFIPRILALKPEVLVVTSDHSTPSFLKSHSWHPNPFLLFSPNALTDNVKHFSEKECSQGYLGIFQAKYAMPLMLAHAKKLKKFGA